MPHSSPMSVLCKFRISVVNNSTYVFFVTCTFHNVLYSKLILCLCWNETQLSYNTVTILPPNLAQYFFFKYTLAIESRHDAKFIVMTNPVPPVTTTLSSCQLLFFSVYICKITAIKGRFCKTKSPIADTLLIRQNRTMSTVKPLI